MWKANEKNYHIITFPGQSVSKNRETQFGRDYGPVARQTNTSEPGVDGRILS
jgi:hypothetical protein